jgi:3-methyladenine DNA glycosylase AlkD
MMQLYAKTLAQYLRERGNPSIAAAQSKYMRNKFPYFGIMQKPLVEAYKEFTLMHGAVDKKDTLPFMKACMQFPEREMWYIGLGQLRKNISRIDKNPLPMFKEIIIGGDWWDITDVMASSVVGDYIKKNPEYHAFMDQWVRDKNYWIRRTAIIYQLKYKDQVDFERLKKYILLCQHEKEFFIRKAIGWSLREYSKHNAQAVIEFVGQHQKGLSPLSIREGLKWINTKINK